MRQMVMAWIGEGLRKLWPVRVESDPIGQIQRDALAEQMRARAESQKAAKLTTIAARSFVAQRIVDDERPRFYN